MNPTLPGWPRLSTAVYYEDARAVIDFLCRAFGCEVGVRRRPGHGEQQRRSGEAGAKFPWRRSPSQVNGRNPQNLTTYVADVEAHQKRAP